MSELDLPVLLFPAPAPERQSTFAPGCPASARRLQVAPPKLARGGRAAVGVGRALLRQCAYGASAARPVRALSGVEPICARQSQKVVLELGAN